jgi:predicted ABC-type ATPase
LPGRTAPASPWPGSKSSLIRQVEFEGRENLLEPDAIARRINPDLPKRAGIPAGREVLRRSATYLRADESFAIETTLAGNWTNDAIRAALERFFFVRLFYICLNNPERSIQRVPESVAQGGHDVPDTDVRRRYARSLSNARQLLPIIDQALVFDNSGAEPRPVFEMRKGQILNTADEIPIWATALLA